MIISIKIKILKNGIIAFETSFNIKSSVIVITVNKHGPANGVENL